jgi:uncharacterized protein (TIGR00251 family)
LGPPEARHIDPAQSFAEEGVMERAGEAEFAGLRPWKREGDGLRLAVRATPRARRSELAGIASDADGRPLLMVRLAAPPVEGAANDELVRFLAALLDLRRSQVAIRSGDNARIKQLLLSGDADQLAARLESLIPG